MKTLKILLIICFILCSGAAFAEPDKNVLIILDCSLSMEDKIHGQRKIDIAKNIINQVLPEIPPGINVGLRVYGHQRDALKSFFGIDTCEVSELLVPVGPNTSPLISHKLVGLEPTGWTPICYSLVQAAKNDFLYVRGEKRIILVSDGMETCSGDPCKVAIRLKRRYPDISIDVIGYDLSSEDPSAINNLKCVALATRGRFFTADNPEQLLRSIREIFNISTQVQGKIMGGE